MAKRKVGQKSEALYRAVRFEVKPSKGETSILLAVSEILRALWNSALEERQRVFSEFFAPLYTGLKSANTPEEVLEIRRKLREAYKAHTVTLFDQINGLTVRRASDEVFGGVTRNFQEETIDALDGAYKSFLALRRNGDFDARSPRLRDEGFFQKISGRFGFKIAGGNITLSCGSGRKLSFLVPEFQQGKLGEATKLKKFELYRDEPNLTKSGRFWISVVYELPKPETTSPEESKLVFLALGASSIGIISAKGEEVLKLWRSDKHWMPKIEALQLRLKGRTKGSRGWQKLNSARRRMYQLSSRQRVQDEREIVDYLVKTHGSHFVLTDLVVRSKEGKLADGSKPERGGPLGLNWSAQNTGSLARLVLRLEEKVALFGGSVQKHKLTLEEPTPGVGADNKLWMARKLQESFLANQSV